MAAYRTLLVVFIQVYLVASARTDEPLTDGKPQDQFQYVESLKGKVPLDIDQFVKAGFKAIDYKKDPDANMFLVVTIKIDPAVTLTDKVTGKTSKYSQARLTRNTPKQLMIPPGTRLSAAELGRLTREAALNGRYLWQTVEMVAGEPSAEIKLGPPPPSGEKGIFLSDMDEFDVKVAEGRFAKKGALGYSAGGSDRIKIDGKESPNSISMHPMADSGAVAKYRLAKSAQMFKATVALNDSAGAPGKAAGDGKIPTPITFEVVGDGKVLWKSKQVDETRLLQPCEVEVSDVEILELRITCPGSHVNAHAVWIEPRLLPKVRDRIAEPPLDMIPVAKLDPELEKKLEAIGKQIEGPLAVDRLAGLHGAKVLKGHALPLAGKICRLVMSNDPNVAGEAADALKAISPRIHEVALRVRSNFVSGWVNAGDFDAITKLGKDGIALAFVISAQLEKHLSSPRTNTNHDVLLGLNSLRTINDSGDGHFTSFKKFADKVFALKSATMPSPNEREQLLSLMEFFVERRPDKRSEIIEAIIGGSWRIGYYWPEHSRLIKMISLGGEVSLSAVPKLREVAKLAPFPELRETAAAAIDKIEADAKKQKADRDADPNRKKAEMEADALLKEIDLPWRQGKFAEVRATLKKIIEKYGDTPAGKKAADLLKKLPGK